jgi:hypothetical protein
MTHRGNRGKVQKAKATFPLFPPRLEIPQRKTEGFPHSHSADGDTYSPGAKDKPRPNRKPKQELSTLLRTGTFYFALTGVK